ncbi:36256_t:CDS:1, partial [Gigaspora margarita]
YIRPETPTTQDLLSSVMERIAQLEERNTQLEERNQILESKEGKKMIYF